MQNEFEGNMKTLSCRETHKDCDFIAEGGTEEEVIKNIIDHAIEVHGMRPFEFEPGITMKLRELIQDKNLDEQKSHLNIALESHQ